MRKYSAEERAYLREIVPGHSYKEIAALFNAKFDEPITVNQVNSFIGNNKLNTGLTGRFTKGHAPHNKGKKKWWKGGEETQFKPGHTPKTYRPVGSERINVDGYTEIKVADPNKWKMKHAVLWEKANGPVPKGHVVIFGDGNRSNFEMDNLILVSRSELLIMNNKGLIQNSAELTKAGKAIADIYLKIGERKRRSKEMSAK